MFSLLVAMAPLALHICLTKSDVQLLMQTVVKRWPAKSPSCPSQRFEEELLKAQLQIWSMVQRLLIHLALVALVVTTHVVLEGEGSLLEMLPPVIAYSTHALVQVGWIEIKSKGQLEVVKACFLSCFVVYLLLASAADDLATCHVMEKTSGLMLMLQAVVFIDFTLPVPIYIIGASVLTYNQWQLLGFENLSPMLIVSTFVLHTATVLFVISVVCAIKSYIAAKIDSDDTTSLLLAFRKVLRGACDGELVLDSRTCSIVGDASSLEHLLKTDKKLAETNFLDLFLDAESRQQFEQFLSETESPESGMPRCLRILLQGLDGPVSLDAFCSRAAGQDCHLLALKADPDQFLAPPDAEDAPSPWQWNDPAPPVGRAQSEVVEAFKDLVQMVLLVSNDTASMDVEEVTLSFCRSNADSLSMPTLRSFIRLKDWDRVQGAFQKLSRRGKAKSMRFAQPVLFRIPGGRSRSYLCAKDVEVNVAERDDPKDGGAVRSFEVALTGFDSGYIRYPKEQDLESISEE